MGGGRGRLDPDMTIMKATDIIIVVEGYDAMRIFLEAVRRRHGDAAGQIGLAIGGLKWADRTPVDPTMWEDWQAAARCELRVPVSELSLRAASTLPKIWRCKATED